MRDWRIERCALREKVRKWLFQKNRAWGPSDVRITNEKGWETLPGETGSLCTSECRVFLFCLDSCFESFRVLLDMSGCVPFISLLSRFAVSSRRLNTWSKAHLWILKIKSFCAPSAVPFSTSVQNKIRSFIKPQGSTQVMSEQQN